MLQSDITIMIVDANPARAAIIEAGLREAGHARVMITAELRGLVRRIEALAPDAIIVDLEDPDPDELEHVFEVARSVRRPIAIFVDRSDSVAIEAAVQAGVAAYIVDGLRQERIKPILDMAISRFNAFSRLMQDLAEARSDLADRKVIERAKGILMSMRHLGEAEAYALLRQTAMNEKRKLVEIARSIVTAAQLFQK